jgi:hypothetical protein
MLRLEENILSFLRELKEGKMPPLKLVKNIDVYIFTCSSDILKRSESSGKGKSRDFNNPNSMNAYKNGDEI